MNLKQIYDHLTYGELHTVFLGEMLDTGEISDKNKVRLLSHINAGLVSLYTRFTIKKNVLRVKLTEDVLRYKLTYEGLYVPSASTGFIESAFGNPFEGEVIKITGAKDMQDKPVPLNAQGNPDSAYTNLSNEINIPASYKQSHIFVDVIEGPKQFRASDIVLPEEYTEIDLPFAYLTALGYYIASRVYNPIGIEDPMKQGINYTRLYEQECAKLESVGIDNTDTFSEDRFSRGGWI